MNELDEAILRRRSERMLASLGLVQAVPEPIMRERMQFDRTGTFHFTRIEREGLMVVAAMRKEKH